MKFAALTRTAVALTVLTSSVVVKADIITFSGTMTGLGATGPDASCDPLPFRGIISPDTTVGQSPLGDFAYSHNICLNGAPGVSNGSFLIDFGADSFLGTLTGTATPGSTPMVADLLFNYTITGGTGRFLGATGSFTGTGTSNTTTRPAAISLSYNGSIDAPAVPEPATWATMLIGFGMAGTMMRRRRKIAQIA